MLPLTEDRIQKIMNKYGIDRFDAMSAPRLIVDTIDTGGPFSEPTEADRIQATKMAEEYFEKHPEMKDKLK